MDRREFPPGYYLFREGDLARELYMLISGGVEVRMGGQLLARVSEEGALLGEMSLLLGTPRTATVRTIAQSEFLVIQDIKSLVETQPALLLRIATQLATRLKEMDARFVSLRNAIQAGSSG